MRAQMSAYVLLIGVLTMESPTANAQSGESRVEMVRVVASTPVYSSEGGPFYHIVTLSNGTKWQVPNPGLLQVDVDIKLSERMEI